jgi:hypothetical protein
MSRYQEGFSTIIDLPAKQPPEVFRPRMGPEARPRSPGSAIPPSAFVDSPFSPDRPLPVSRSAKTRGRDRGQDPPSSGIPTTRVDRSIPARWNASLPHPGSRTLVVPRDQLEGRERQKSSE